MKHCDIRTPRHRRIKNQWICISNTPPFNVLRMNFRSKCKDHFKMQLCRLWLADNGLMAWKAGPTSYRVTLSVHVQRIYPGNFKELQYFNIQPSGFVQPCKKFRYHFSITSQWFVFGFFCSEGFEEKEVKEKPVKAKKKPGKILVQPILLDNTGRPVFPIELGPLTIYSLGEVGLHWFYWTTQDYLSSHWVGTTHYLQFRGGRFTLILLDNTGRPVFPIELGPLTIYSLGEVGSIGQHWAPCLPYWVGSTHYLYFRGGRFTLILLDNTCLPYWVGTAHYLYSWCGAWNFVSLENYM